MPEETATAKFDGDLGALLSEIHKLEEELTRLETNFGELGPAATQHLQSIEASARNMGGGLQGAGASGAGAMQSLGSGLMQAASAARIMVSGLSAIGPYIGGLPDSVSRVVAPLKQMFAAVGVTDAATKAFSGRLGILGTAFAYMDARTLGASRGLALFGAAGGLALSTTIAAARGATAAVALLGRAVMSLAGTAAAAAGPLLAIAGPFIALGVAIAGIKSAFDLGGEFADLKEQTGESISNLVVLKQAFVNAGLGGDSVQASINRLQKSLGGLNEEGKSTKAALKELGLSSAELGNYSPIGQIEKLQTAFAGVADEARRTELAQALFGKSGGKMLSLLGDSTALATASDQTGQLGAMLEKNAAIFDKTSDAIGSLKLKFQQLFAGAASRIAPQLSRLFDDLSRMDWTAIGEGIGEVTRAVISLAGTLGRALIKLTGFVQTLKDFFGFKPKSEGVSFLSEKPDAQKREQEFDKIKVGNQRELGGGGAFHLGLGNGGNPELEESRRQSRTLDAIYQVLKGGPRSTALMPVPIAA